MTDNNQDNQVNFHFINLVMSLSQSAFMGMGKISNPQTGKVEKNMEFAKVNIDILQMLQDKTKGNLDKKENEILLDTLTNLQLTYADDIKKKPDDKKEDSKEEKVKEASQKESKK